MYLYNIFSFFVYFLFILLFNLWGRLNFNCAQRLGWLFSSLIMAFKNKVRNVVEKNIVLCFPKLNNYYYVHFVRNSIRQFGITASEFPVILFAKGGRLLTNIRAIYGEDDFFACPDDGCEFLQVDFIV